MRVLIVNAILMGDDNATGVTMENMLYNMPSVNYLQYCIDHRKNCHKQLVDTIFMNAEDSFADYFVQRLKNKNTGSWVGSNRNPVVTNANSGSVIGDLARGMIDSLPCKISPENMKKIELFKPNLIYTMGSTIRVMQVAISLSKKLKIPIVFHCMDDWRSTRYMRSVFSRPFNKVLRWKIKEINKRSVMNIGICKKMADFYAREYGRPYSYASNCVFRFNDEGYIASDQQGMTIIFSGGLHFHRGERLRQVGELIEKLNSSGYRIKLKIFSPAGQVEMFSKLYNDLTHTICLPYVEKGKQMENLMSADILLHVESDDPTDNKHMEYSFSTKLVEYFAAGRVVLGLGDSNLSSIQYIKDMECGLVAEDLADLEKALIHYTSDVSLRMHYADKAVRVAREFHSQEAVQKRIYDVFQIAVEKGI